MMRAGEELTLDVDRPAAGGRMIARVDGRIVFVAGAIPGERVRARVERVRGGVGYAETLEPIEASPDRRPAGPDPACGGNAYAHVAYPRQLELKAAIIADAFTRIGHLAVEPPAVLGSPETGYRLRARLHVRDGRVGFYREGTHDLCDAALAGQLSDAALAVVRRLGAAIRAGHLDNATAVDLAENVDGTERAAQIDLDPARRARSQFDHVLSVEGLSGVAVTLGGRRVLAARGTLTLTDRLTLEDGVASAEVALRRHVAAFFQANRFLLPALVSRVARQVPREGTVLDLYSGSGLFAVSLAALGHQSVVAVEGDRQGVADLQANAAPFGGRLRAVGMAVEQFLADPGESAPAAVLVDPPRTGLSREALDGIAGLRAPRILYVSCDVATLARDAARLVSAGYALDHLEGFDLFPNTAHVESLAVFRRGSDGPAAGA